MTAVLFVCAGNTCRSPMAEGVLRHLLDKAGLAEQVSVDSAGTQAGRVGAPPDARAQAVAAWHGIDLARQRARRLRADGPAPTRWSIPMPAPWRTTSTPFS